MKIFIGCDNCVNVIGVDKEEEMFEVEDENPDWDNEEPKYVRFGSSVIWEGQPPTCKKCKQNNTVSSCNNQCYDFKALCGKGSQKVVDRHNSKRRSNRELIQHEFRKIDEMKKDGREYTSWLHKSLFESEDNTERMDFSTSTIRN